MKETKIGIRKEVKEDLDSLKIYKGEPYDEVLGRLFDIYIKQMYIRVYDDFLMEEYHRAYREVDRGQIYTTNKIIKELSLSPQKPVRGIRVYWTKTAFDNLKKLRPYFADLVVKKAHRNKTITTPPFPEAWHALDILNFAVFPRRSKNKKKRYIVTIGRRNEPYSSFTTLDRCVLPHK